MILIAIGAFLIFIPIIILKRRIFHQLLVRFYLVSFVACLWYSPFFYKIHISLEILYSHQTFKADELIGVIQDNRIESFIDKGEPALNKGILQSEVYIQQYGTRNGFTFIHDFLVDNYNEYVFFATRDTSLLPLALKAVRQEYKILSLFHFDVEPHIYFEELVMESDVLLAMGKKEEAIQSLEKLLQQNPPQGLKEIIVKKLNEIKSK